MEGFFGHKNQSFPPSLSQYGKLRSGTKSDLLSCLEKNGPAQAQRPSVDALPLDGAAIINMLKSGASKTFQEYSETVFLPYVINQLRNVERVNVVWDRYLPSSLKDSARSKRGKGIRRRVRSDTRIPGDWTSFLRVDENKQEHYLYLAEQLTTIGTEHGEVVSTKHETVVLKMTELALQIYHLARTKKPRLLLHATDAARH